MPLRSFINSKSNINLVFIPGGPGLSSVSFNQLMPLNKNFSLFYFDPMGTTTELKQIPNYGNLLEELKNAIKNLDNVVLCGHSFGGIQAIDILSENLNNIMKLIVIGSPVSESAVAALRENFKIGIAKRHNIISDKLANRPTDEIYKEWFYIYRDFYFNPKRSDELISIITEDTVCVKNYSEAIAESFQKSAKLNEVKNINIPKLFIAGNLDRVMPVESAKHDANKGGFKLKIVEDAGHFVHYECPKSTIRIINEFLTNKRR